VTDSQTIEPSDESLPNDVPNPTDLKITYIGGGSRSWAIQLMSDLAVCETHSGDVSLYDVDLEGARRNARLGNEVVDQHENAVSDWTYTAEGDLGTALSGADFVMISTQFPIPDTHVKDLEITKEHGIFHPVDSDVANADRLARKHDTARTLVPKPDVERMPGARLGTIASGTTQFAIEEARATLADRGQPTGFLRLKALPVQPEVERFITDHDEVVVIEMNRDGQLHAILLTEYPRLATRIGSIAHLDGMPFTAAWVVERLKPFLTKREVA
jgi:hypothetical protein